MAPLAPDAPESQLDRSLPCQENAPAEGLVVSAQPAAGVRSRAEVGVQQFQSGEAHQMSAGGGLTATQAAPASEAEMSSTTQFEGGASGLVAYHEQLRERANVLRERELALDVSFEQSMLAALQVRERIIAQREVRDHTMRVDQVPRR